MEITVKELTGWEYALDACRFTVNKHDIHKDPTDDFKASVLLAEHSPIRILTFMVDIKNVPSWVSQHIARHDAFAYHTVRECASDVHFVSTQRSDRTGVDRKKLPQDNPVNHRIYLNAQDLINISRRRLCNCASKETREVWNAIRDEVGKIEPVLRDKMRRECVYRGFCPERECCGYVNTEQYKKEVEEYRKNHYERQ